MGNKYPKCDKKLRFRIVCMVRLCRVFFESSYSFYERGKFTFFGNLAYHVRRIYLPYLKFTYFKRTHCDTLQGRWLNSYAVISISISRSISIHPPTYPPNHPSIHPTNHSSTHPTIRPSIHPTVNLLNIASWFYTCLWLAHRL